MELWDYERQAWNSGAETVCGVDEAGAGPLMGPVYAAAVILPRELDIPGLNDSKKLTEKKREALYEVITTQAVSWSVTRVEAWEIDEMDILNARMLAMQRAIEGLSVRPDTAFIDGNQPIRHRDATSAHRRRGRQKRLHRGGVHSGEGQPGPVCVGRAGRKISPVPVR
jgi:ribonuclease HII